MSAPSAAAGRPATVVQLSDDPRDGWGEDLVAYAVEKIDAVLARTRGPVLHSRLRVLRHHDPADSRPVIARATVDVDGQVLHVEASAATPRAAVDHLVDRLSRRIEHETRRRTAPIARAVHRPQQR